LSKCTGMVSRTLPSPAWLRRLDWSTVPVVFQPVLLLLVP